MHALIPFCTGIRAPSFYQDFIGSIEAALAELGHTSERFRFAAIGQLSQDELQRLLDWTRAARCDVVLDLCCWGYALSHVRLQALAAVEGDAAPNTLSPLDALGAAWLPLLLDQPQFQPLAAIQSSRLLIAYPDATHPPLIRRICPQLKPAGAGYVPPATGRHNDRSPRRWREKSIALLYVGNFAPQALERFWADHPLAALFDAASEIADAQPALPLLNAIDEAARELAGAGKMQGSALPGEDLLELLRSLEFARRHRFRHRLILSLSRVGLPLTVVGSGWDQAGLAGNVTLRPEGDYTGFMTLLGEARIVLDASSYVGGINDRAFHAAINGCGFLTNADAALRPVFGKDAGVGFYAMARCEEAAGTLSDWLARPAELEQRALRARALTLSSHLWRHRVETLLRLVTGSG